MDTREAIQEMNAIAKRRGFKVTQGVVYGNYSHREEGGVKVQNVMRTYEKKVYELVNPASCVICGRFAKWQFADDTFYCDSDLPSTKLTLSFDAATDEIY